jgi:hypothetical protein
LSTWDHLFSVSFLISENVQAVTLEVYLRALEMKIVNRAKEIKRENSKLWLMMMFFTDKSQEHGTDLQLFLPGNRKPDEIKRLVEVATEISKTGKWRPAFFMIDKSSAELRALESGE